MRLAALLVALLAWTGLALQAGASWDLGGRPPVPVLLWRMAGYFTVLTNLLAALMFFRVALGGTMAARAAGALTAAILMVAIVYHALLARLWDPQGVAWLADQILHGAVPAAVLLWWAVWAPKSGLRGRDALVWLGWPLLYLAYAMVRQVTAGFVPYPFLDLAALGPGRVALNVALAAAGFWATGICLAVLGRLLSR